MFYHWQKFTILLGELVFLVIIVKTEIRNGKSWICLNQHIMLKLKISLSLSLSLSLTLTLPPSLDRSIDSLSNHTIIFCRVKPNTIVPLTRKTKDLIGSEWRWCICISVATCLSVHFCGLTLIFQISVSVLYKSSYHQKVTWSRHDLTRKIAHLALINNQSLAMQYTVHSCKLSFSRLWVSTGLYCWFVQATCNIQSGYMNEKQLRDLVVIRLEWCMITMFGLCKSNTCTEYMPKRLKETCDMCCTIKNN